mmetsp:Transcript_76660/g.213078  ORF Transcript_76660/g.213078 Transcript_76660/m.213078 type:complete len:140 (+) Transcript_76660:96-515(+)
MSSLQQAIANDIARGQSRGNPVVQNHRSQRDDGNIHRELEERRKAEADARKLQRLAEGGRAGGFNDRQEATKASRRPQDEGGYDDFGRRVSARQKGVAHSERTRAALQRLQQRVKQGLEGSDCRHRKSRSRSPRDAKRR